jgi:hypothetical protein
LGHAPRPARRDREDSVGVVATYGGQPALVDRRLGGVAPAQPLDALPDLADDQDAQIKLAAVDRCHPGADVLVAVRLARLRDDVRIE